MAKQQIIVKTYEGKRQSDAAKKFQADAQKMAADGYRPVSQSWADGRAGCMRILTLGLFSLVWKPDGTLTVTYELTAGSS